MILFAILGGIVLVAIGVIGFLFYLMSKEVQQPKAEQVVPITDISKLKESLKSPDAKKLEVPVIQPIVSPPVGFSSTFEVEKAQAIAEANYQKKIDELQNELKSIAAKADEQSKQALESVEQLKVENEKLKSEQHAKELAVQAKLIQAQGEVDSMRQEQETLQKRLQDGQVEVGKLKEEIVAIEQKMSAEVFKSKTETELLQKENESLKKLMDDKVAEAVKDFAPQMEALKEENQSLKNANQELSGTNQKLKEQHDVLVEKAESLEWELTKTRAQLTSFERACENYQTQLQGALDKISSFEKNQNPTAVSGNEMVDTNKQEVTE